MQRDPTDEADPAAVTWRAIRRVLESEVVRFDVTPLARTAVAVYAHTNPGIAFVIGVDGDTEVQIDRAAETWFDRSQISLLVERTLPELFSASREDRIVNEVVHDRHGRISRARTSFRGQVPTGMQKSYERRYSRQVRQQMAAQSRRPRLDTMES